MEQKERESVGVTREDAVAGKEQERRVEDQGSAEIESVVKKIERKLGRQAKRDPGDIQDDAGVVVQPQSDQPAVTVSVTQDDVAQGKKLPVASSFRWLIEWVVRQVKKYGGRVVWQSESRRESDNPALEEVETKKIEQGREE